MATVGFKGLTNCSVSYNNTVCACGNETGMNWIGHWVYNCIVLLQIIVYYQALVLCFRLHFAKDSTTTNTAAATIRQIVSVVFERVVTEDNSPEPG